ncbi:MAG: phenylalanine--tRNA ligase beta subunit-related protein [Salinivirgaceae bacterium]|jgi:DNA/RNA-binding domain of Phe-tRNA-synthetase-like protein|nr:phenylalanine--tRNA ligase beta subunit-related protein [Salinivirgaceae bacterium]
MNEFRILISKELKEKNPGMALGTLVCHVSNSDHSNELWDEIEKVSREIRDQYTMETIKTNPQITATRNMYLACGKKPGRYRPSAEALMRRIVKGDSLYQINTLVDLVNLLSLKTGYSIGGFDVDYMVGNVEAGIGREGEPYEGIGKGMLNIQNLPILRDEKSAIGTPTSDEVRTAIRLETSRFFMNINGYTGKEDVIPALDYAEELLVKYVNASDIVRRIVE